MSFWGKFAFVGTDGGRSIAVQSMLSSPNSSSAMVLIAAAEGRGQWKWSGERIVGFDLAGSNVDLSRRRHSSFLIFKTVDLSSAPEEKQIL